MKKVLLLLLGVVLIVILSYFCFMGKAQGINDDLVSKTQTAYKGKQMKWIDVEVKGKGLEMTRTLVLSGIAPTSQEREEAEVMAREIDGVLDVDNQLVVKVTTPLIPVSYKIAVTKNKLKQVTLSGDVPNIDIHNQLVTKAKILFGNENVIDKLTELKGNPTAWKESITLGLDRLVDVDYGRFNLSNTSFHFEGYVRTEEEKAVLLEQLNAQLSSNYKASYNIEVPKVVIPSPYTIRALKNNTKQVILTGYVANADIHNELVSHAAKIFGDGNVIDKLKEVKGSPKKWKESFILGLDNLMLVDYGQFNISDMDYNFSGYIGSQDVKSLIITNLNTQLNSKYNATYNISAPSAKSFLCQENFESLLAKEKINFEHDRAAIKESSYSVLNKLVEIAQQCPNTKIEIEGHTDSDGSEKYNQKLSFKRANAVKKYLIEKEINSSRLNAIGYGEVNPVTTNTTSKGKEQNRRIEFNVKGIK